MGFLHVHRDAALLQHCLSMEGLGWIRVSAMGGKMVLLKSVKEGEIESAQVHHKEWWFNIFKEVKHWTPNLISKSKKVSLFVLNILDYSLCRTKKRHWLRRLG